MEFQEALDSLRLDNPNFLENFKEFMGDHELYTYILEIYRRHVGHPWLSCWTDDINNSVLAIPIRHVFAKKYSWAIPSEEAIQALVKLGPLVEIGAGNGYWACLLRKRNVDIVAYDKFPPASNNNRYHCQKQWTEVLEGGPEQLKSHSGRTLFLCWPPYSNKMAEECLDFYRGSTIVYIGEGFGGGCATDEFFEKLAKHYHIVDEFNIPQWNGIHDCMSVWGRGNMHV